jgi:hypothetical protein
VNAFDVHIYTIRRRKGRRRPFEVRWQATGRARSKSFLTRGLADSWGGILSESTYGRVWRAARELALGPELAAAPLARRPYDLRHAALSLWLNATSAPTQVAARAGNSVHVLQDVYVHCIDGREDVVNRQIEDTLDPDCGTLHGSQCVTASGHTHRRYRPDPVRHMSVNDPRWLMHGPQSARPDIPGRPPKKRPVMVVSPVQKPY